MIRIVNSVTEASKVAVINKHLMDTVNMNQMTDLPIMLDLKHRLMDLPILVNV